MDTRERTIWSALSAAIGPEKTAALKNTPLDDIVRQKVAREEGVSVDNDAIMYDLMAVVGKKAARKKEKYKSIKRASKNLSSSQKEGSRSVFKKLARSEKYRILEDIASGAEKQNIRRMRKKADRDAYTKLQKEAAGSILAPLKSGLKELGEHSDTMAKGLMGGTGAAVPTYIAGSALIGDAEESSENVMDDARNTALQTGAGLGGMYLAGKGVSSLMSGGEEPNPVNTKESSVSSELEKVAEKIQDFTSTVFLDQLFQKTAQKEDYEKVAQLNTDYGVDIALDLLIR